MDHFSSKLADYMKKDLINMKLKDLLQEFHDSYTEQAHPQMNLEKNSALFECFLDLIIDKIKHPYAFSIFHESIRQPFDYYQFGLDFIRPFIDFAQSRISGLASLRQIQEQLKNGENVILLANHQTEPDPQIISLLVEPLDPKLASDMIFVAGQRVITDPLAIPMSLGRNLLCIYSKKYMDHPPEEKNQKILHNQKTLKKMQELLDEGGKCIYVAPSGGRDRINASGEIEVSPFDPQSIELFWLNSRQSKHTTHFYPLALKTYHLMPPPGQVVKELGEKRTIHFTPIYLSFGEEIQMESFSENKTQDKKIKRQKRADHIWQQVNQAYQQFPSD